MKPVSADVFMRNDAQSSRIFRLAGERKAEQDLYFREALDPSLWRADDSRAWDAYWATGMPPPAVFREAADGRSINHIPGNGCLTIKNRLYQTVTAMRDRLADQFGADHEAVARASFIPQVFAMPQDYHDLQQAAFETPHKRWILKPKNSSRGRGIRVVQDVAAVPTGAPWMVQEYLDDPHVMYGHKYVLRLYVLISALEPLRVYLYRQGFAKLASDPYCKGDWGNPYVHLTNPDVNAGNTESDSPVVFIDLGRYRAWLRNQGGDDERLFAHIRDLVALTVISAREQMRRSTLTGGAGSAACYELLGLDCLVDATLKPWLLECNLSPSMGVCAAPCDGGEVEGVIKRQLVTDMVSLLGLNLPRSATSPTIDLGPEIVDKAGAELARAGGFERVWPVANAEDYLPFFSLPRLGDMILADAANGAPVARPRLRRRHATEVSNDDRLTLYSAVTGETFATNPTAAFVWRAATGDSETGNTDPDEIAAALCAALETSGQESPPSPSTVTNDVWSSLADWAEAQLLVQDAHGSPVQGTHGSRSSSNSQSSAQSSTRPERPSGLAAKSVTRLDLQVGASPLRLILHGDPLRAYLEPAITPLIARSPTDDAPRLEIARALHGFCALLDGRLVAEHLPLAELGCWLVRLLRQSAAGDGEITLSGCLVPVHATSGEANHDPSALWFIDDCAGGLNAAALALGIRIGGGFSGGVRLAGLSPDRAAAIGLPVRVTATHLDRLRSMGRDAAAEALVCTTEEAADYLVPAATGVNDASYRIRAIIINRPVDAADATTAPEIAPAAVDQVLTALLSDCVAAGRRAPSADVVAALANWLPHVERYAVDLADMDDVAALTRALGTNGSGTTVAGP